MKHNQYDVIVIGAGPAGSVAAGGAAQAGLTTLLLEKRREIGVPVRCGEATGNRAEISRFIPVDEAWIESDVRTFIIRSVLGAEIRRDQPDTGLLLNRAKFDQALARQAADQGAEVVTGAAARGLIMEQGEIPGVKVLQDGRELAVRCRMLIAADGSESMVSRWAGWGQTATLANLTSGLEYELDGAFYPPASFSLLFGRGYLPNGYIWAFSKDKTGTTKVGASWLAASWTAQRTLKHWLDEYCRKHHPQAKILKTVGGAIPLHMEHFPLAGRRLLLAGDAGHLANPLSAGGIMNALESGQLAGEWAVKAFRQGRWDRDFLKGYDRAVRQKLWRLHQVHSRLRGGLEALDDQQLSRFMSAIVPLVAAVDRQALTQPSFYWQMLLPAFRALPAMPSFLKGFLLG